MDSKNRPITHCSFGAFVGSAIGWKYGRATNFSAPGTMPSYGRRRYLSVGQSSFESRVPFFVVFYLYIVLIVFYPVLDFPLREYAARYSAWILDVLHLAP